MNLHISEIKDSEGNTRSLLVRLDEAVKFSDLKNLSTETGHTVYLVPESVEVKFNNDGWLLSAEGTDVNEIWQFVNGWPMPYECFTNGFPFPVQMEEMWNSEKSVETIEIRDLEWNLTYPWWSSDDETPYNMAPLELLDDTRGYENHLKRVNESELKYPLLLVETKQGRWLIYDGLHRLVKQILLGERKILAKKFKIEEMEGYIHESDLERFGEWREL